MGTAAAARPRGRPPAARRPPSPCGPPTIGLPPPLAPGGAAPAARTRRAGVDALPYWPLPPVCSFGDARATQRRSTKAVSAREAGPPARPSLGAAARARSRPCIHARAPARAETRARRGFEMRNPPGLEAPARAPRLPAARAAPRRNLFAGRGARPRQTHATPAALYPAERCRAARRHLGSGSACVAIASLIGRGPRGRPRALLGIPAAAFSQPA